MEIWKKISGYENYEVSNLGNVVSLSQNHKGHIKHKRKEIKPWSDTRGYQQVKLYNNGIGKSFSVHKLVAETFIGRPDGELVIDHIDNDKKNNRVDNLQFISHRQNVIKEIDINKKSSRYTGVYWSKWHKKWAASIQQNTKKTHLGFYEDEEVASKKYNDYKKENNLI